VRTDHPSLLSIHVNYADRGYDASGVRRFNLKYLSDPVACRLLANTFADYAAPLFRSVHFIRENLGLVRSVPDRQAIVDAFDEELRACLSLSCEYVLGSYDASAIHFSPRRPPSSLPSNPAETACVFKSSYRSVPRAPLVSRSPSLSVMDDVMDFCSDVRRQPDPMLLLDDSEDRFPLGVGTDGLSSFFSPIAVWRAIRRYPASKSCGIDSLHARVFQAIAGEEDSPRDIVHLLSLQFQWCA